MNAQEESIVRVERHGDIRVLTPKVPLRRDSLDELLAALEGKLDRTASLVIDLTHVGLIDGVGLEWLLELDESAAQYGGCVRLCGANDLPSDILRISGVGSRLYLADNLTQCLSEMAI